MRVSKKPKGSISGIHPRREKIEPTSTALETKTLTSRILERKAPFVHFILLGSSPRKIMHGPRSIPFHFQRTGSKGPLFSNQDVEIIISGVQPRVSLRPQRRAKDDQVFGDACVDDVHGAHGAASIVEYPFLFVRVDPNLRGWVGCG